MLFDTKYDLIFSLGEACSCTQTLRKNRLQFYSYPFDWLYGSEILSRTRLIADNFYGFIDMEDLEDLNFDNKSEHNLCEVYKNKKNGICFNHDFAYGKPLAETYPVVREKYNRRINRLMSQIENSKNVLVVYIQSPANTEMLEDEVLVQVREILRQRFPNQKINLLYLFSNSNAEKVKTIKVGEDILKLMTDYSAHNVDFPFEINDKVLRKVFYKLKISTKFMTGKNIVKRIFYRIKCIFRGLL